MGTKWGCPDCGILYFVYWMRIDRFWNNPGESQQNQLLDSLGQPYYNDHRGKFVARNESGELEDTGAFVIVLTYYESLCDESTWKACEEADDAQWVWYFSDMIM
jgi:hypothetical protein